jgi:hypothetical protein
MPRAILAPFAAVLVVTAALAGCTPTPDSAGSPTPQPSSAASSAAPSNDSATLPQCALVTGALGALADGLEYNEKVSVGQLGQEAYEQRICVYTSPDESVQLGVTISVIPFLETELEAYGALPTAIADERATAIHAVLQTLAVENGSADHLDSTLFLFDTTYSIAILGQSAGGETSAALPQLTVGAASDSAFAIRALIH